LKLSDLEGDRLTVNRSVWHGKEQLPKTQNAVRTLALSPHLQSLLKEQIERQQAKGHSFLFSTSTGTPWDMNVYRYRKMRLLLRKLGIPQAGLHAFRHFNVSLLDALNTPLKVIQERAGHALTGSFTLDVYGGKPEWIRNVEAAHKAGKAIHESVVATEEAKADRFVSLTAIQEKGLSAAYAQALENAG
jgi:integrase